MTENTPKKEKDKEKEKESEVASSGHSEQKEKSSGETESGGEESEDGGGSDNEQPSKRGNNSNENSNKRPSTRGSRLVSLPSNDLKESSINLCYCYCVLKCCRCFEILGFDVMIDANLKPWIIEVNHLPRYLFFYFLLDLRILFFRLLTNAFGYCNGNEQFRNRLAS